MIVHANKVKGKESEGIRRQWVYLVIAIAGITCLISSAITYAQEVTYAAISPTAELLVADPTRAFLSF